MQRFLLVSFLFTVAALPVARAQQPAARTVPAPAVYGTALVQDFGLGSWTLALSDGVTPNPSGKRYQENGKVRKFPDEAAVLNFLYSQGWEVLPNGLDKAGDARYMLRRRRQ